MIPNVSLTRAKDGICYLIIIKRLKNQHLHHFILVNLQVLWGLMSTFPWRYLTITWMKVFRDINLCIAQLSCPRYSILVWNFKGIPHGGLSGGPSLTTHQNPTKLTWIGALIHGNFWKDQAEKRMSGTKAVVNSHTRVASCCQCFSFLWCVIAKRSRVAETVWNVRFPPIWWRLQSI